jgi:hypothetical protein
MNEIPSALADVHELVVARLSVPHVAQQLPHLIEPERSELTPDTRVLERNEVLRADVDGSLAIEAIGQQPAARRCPL